MHDHKTYMPDYIMYDLLDIEIPQKNYFHR